MVTLLMAQVMTRGMVTSRFIIQWAIRIQVSDIYNISRPPVLTVQAGI